MMMKKILFKISVIASGFSFLFVTFFFAIPVFAKSSSVQLATISNIYYAKEDLSIDATDTSVSLTVNDILKINQNDGQIYTIQGNWDNSFDDNQYLQLVFQSALPANAQLLTVSLEHIFSKNAANDSNLILANYEVDKDYILDNWLVDWQSNNFDISSVPASTNINESIDLLTAFPDLTVDEINSLAVRFRAQKEASGTIAKTDHDLFVLNIEYKLLPLVPELYSPQDFTFINSETANALRPQFNWQNIDPNYYYKIQLNRTELDEPYVCDFSSPYLEEIVSGVSHFQPLTDLKDEGVYCWRVGVSDDGGTTFYWSDHYIFTIDITQPSAPQTLKIQPAASMFTQVNRPRVFGTFSASDTDPQKAIIVFENTALNSAYIYKIPRINDSFDSNSIGSKLYYLSDISKLCLSSGIERTGLWDEVAEADYMKDGNYKVYGLSEDEAGNRTDLVNKIPLAGLYKIDTQAPLAPVVSVSTEDSRVIVSWNAVEDGIYYEVYRDGNLVAYTNSTIFIEENLPQGRTYTYWVIAVDQAGNRSQPSEKKSVYIYFPRVSSVSYAPAVSYVPMEGISEVQAKEKPEEVSQLPEGEVKAEEPAPAAVAKGANWALITAIILGILLALGGGLYWWYSREEDEI